MIEITHRPVCYTVEDVLRLLKHGDWILQPKFQRRRTVWPVSAKSYLIDSLLRNMPIPTMYIREKIDVQSKKKIREVIDGQQRLSIIQNYLNNEFAIDPKLECEYAGLKFNDLDYEVQEHLKGFELSFEIIKGADDKNVLEIFARVNSYSEPLNNQEKLNAEFAGYFKQMIFGLASYFIDFWKKFKVFPDKQLSRMREVDLVSYVIVTILNGHSTNTKVIRDYYKKYDSDLPNRNEIVRRFNVLINMTSQLFEDKLIASTFKKPALLYSLLLALYGKGYSDIGSGVQMFDKKVEIKISSSKIQEKLRKFCEDYTIPDKYEDFQLAVRGGTRSVKARRIRHETLLSTLE